MNCYFLAKTKADVEKIHVCFQKSAHLSRLAASDWLVGDVDQSAFADEFEFISRFFFLKSMEIFTFLVLVCR